MNAPRALWKLEVVNRSEGLRPLHNISSALEMGNSAAIVMRHYFDIVEKRAAEAYWNIKPVSHGDRKIVALR